MPRASMPRTASVGWDPRSARSITTGNPLDVAVQGHGLHRRAGRDRQRGLHARRRPARGSERPAADRDRACRCWATTARSACRRISSITVAPDGTISIVPLGSDRRRRVPIVGTHQTRQSAGRHAAARRRRLCSAPATADPADADAATTVTPGTLEGEQCRTSPARW